MVLNAAASASGLSRKVQVERPETSKCERAVIISSDETHSMLFKEIGLNHSEAADVKPKMSCQQAVGY